MAELFKVTALEVPVPGGGERNHVVGIEMHKEPKLEQRERRKLIREFVTAMAHAKYPKFGARLPKEVIERMQKEVALLEHEQGKRWLVHKERLTRQDAVQRALLAHVLLQQSTLLERLRKKFKEFLEKKD